jgi:CheY-like chemotaxis protein
MAMRYPVRIRSNEAKTEGLQRGGTTRISRGEVTRILDSIPGLVALLTSTGDVEVVNRQLVEYFGQTPDLQQELIRRRHHIPIVFITAEGDEAARRRVLPHGAVECLFKPFSETALLDALATAFG